MDNYPAGYTEVNKEEQEVNCLDCGKPYEEFGMDVVLPHSQWAMIHPDERGVLCANCIVNRVSKIKGAIVIHAVVEFCPQKNKSEPRTLLSEMERHNSEFELFKKDFADVPYNELVAAWRKHCRDKKNDKQGGYFDEQGG